MAITKFHRPKCECGGQMIRYFNVVPPVHFKGYFPGEAAKRNPD
jgi:hypothetical protein